MASDLASSSPRDEESPPRSRSSGHPPQAGITQQAKAHLAHAKQDAVPTSVFLQDLLREQKEKTQKVGGNQRRSTIRQSAPGRDGRVDQADRGDEGLIQSSPVWRPQNSIFQPPDGNARRTSAGPSSGCRGMGAREMEEVRFWVRTGGTDL